MVLTRAAAQVAEGNILEPVEAKVEEDNLGVSKPVETTMKLK